jgi:hypothetical protein
MAQKIVIEWQGEKYVIPENEVFEAVEKLEEVVTFGQLDYLARNLATAKIARAMSVLLDHAGADKCSPSEVRQWMTDSIKAMLQEAVRTGKAPDPQDVRKALFAEIVSLLGSVLMDGAPEVQEDDPAPKKTSPSSGKRSKSRSLT